MYVSAQYISLQSKENIGSSGKEKEAGGRAVSCSLLWSPPPPAVLKEAGWQYAVETWNCIYLVGSSGFGSSTSTIASSQQPREVGIEG